MDTKCIKGKQIQKRNGITWIYFTTEQLSDEFERTDWKKLLDEEDSRRKQRQAQKS